MRIVNLETFLTLPEGTLYSKYEPCIFEQLAIKGESIIFKNPNLAKGEAPGDFYVQSLPDAIKCDDSHAHFNLLEEAENFGADIELDFNCECRDGMFEAGQLFAVFTPEDTAQLVEKLLSYPQNASAYEALQIGQVCGAGSESSTKGRL